VGSPVGRLDLVLDQLVDGFGVRHPQQGLGQAHQADTLRGGKAVFGEKALHHRGGGLGTHALDDLSAGSGNRLSCRRIQLHSLHQVRQNIGLGGARQARIRRR